MWEQTSNHDVLLNSKPGSVLYKLYHQRMEGNPEAFIKGNITRNTSGIYSAFGITLALDGMLLGIGLISTMKKNKRAKQPKPLKWVY